MSEMVERVAAAILAEQQNNKSAFPSNLDLARAAIVAMRELPENPGPRYTAGEYSRRTQEAMVDDALAVTNGDRK
jgi:hypothetical protein